MWANNPHYTDTVRAMPRLRNRALGPAGFRFAAPRTRTISSRSAGFKQACEGVFDMMGSKHVGSAYQ